MRCVQYFIELLDTELTIPFYSNAYGNFVKLKALCLCPEISIEMHTMCVKTERFQTSHNSGILL